MRLVKNASASAEKEAGPPHLLALQASIFEVIRVSLTGVF